jgi:hypothetical protein
VGPLLSVELPGLLDDTLGGVLPLEEKIQSVIGVGGPRDYSHFLTGEVLFFGLSWATERFYMDYGRVQEFLTALGIFFRQMAGNSDASAERT